MTQRPYFERQKESLDEIVRWLEFPRIKDIRITRIYIEKAKDILLYLHRNNVELDYKAYEEKIKSYQK